jgi:hypothetical protein
MALIREYELTFILRPDIQAADKTRVRATSVLDTVCRRGVARVAGRCSATLGSI